MAKKKQKATGNTANLAAKPGGPLAAAADWPILEVLVSNRWDTPGNLVSMLIARRSPKTGKVAAAALLIDLGCLGIKDAHVKVHKDTTEYSTGLREHARRGQPLAAMDFDLAAKIAFTAVDYADSLGFKPSAVFAQARPLFEGANPDAVTTVVPTGDGNGKPLFMPGPYDNAARIVAQLNRSVGEGNYNVVIVDPSGFDMFDDEFDDD